MSIIARQKDTKNRKKLQQMNFRIDLEKQISKWLLYTNQDLYKIHIKMVPCILTYNKVYKIYDINNDDFLIELFGQFMSSNFYIDTYRTNKDTLEFLSFLIKQFKYTFNMQVNNISETGGMFFLKLLKNCVIDDLVVCRIFLYLSEIQVCDTIEPKFLLRYIKIL
jgi:hypothetical protein